MPRGTPGRRPTSSVHWTEEEKATLLKLVEEGSRANGWVAPGFDINAAKVLGKTASAISSFRWRLVKTGKFPRAIDRTTYKPLVLTDADAAYLAGILDGDGTIHFKIYKIQPTKLDPKGREHSVRAHIVLVYNTDWGILKKVASLVPFSRTKVAMNSKLGGLGKKTLYGVHVTGFRNVHVVLKRILPFLAHEGKIKAAKDTIEYLEAAVQQPVGIRRFSLTA